MAGDMLLAALPDRLATLPLVGIDAELRHAALFRTLGQHEFRRRGLVAFERDAGRRNSEQHRTTVGADRSRAGFDHDVG